MAEAGLLFCKRESYKVLDYRSGQHKTELDVLVVRRQQLWWMEDCKVIAGGHATQAPSFHCAYVEGEGGKTCGAKDKQIVEMSSEHSMCL